MASLLELKKHTKAKIKSIQSDKDLKNRLKSFGVKIGTEIVVKDFALNKSTMSILVGKTVLALRNEEAEKIEVEDEQ